MMYTSKIVNGDEVREITNSGYELVSNKDKIRQDVTMILSTDMRDTGLGAALDEVIGKDSGNPISGFSNTPFMFEFQMRVKTALIRLQRAQNEYQFNQRTPKELIQEISYVNVWPSANDPREYRWEVNVLTIDGSASFTVGGITQ